MDKGVHSFSKGSNPKVNMSPNSLTKISQSRKFATKAQELLSEKDVEYLTMNNNKREIYYGKT